MREKQSFAYSLFNKKVQFVAWYTQYTTALHGQRQRAV